MFALVRSAASVTILALALALATTTGCYGTRSAPGGAGVAAMKRGGHGGEIVLKQGLLGIHIGPRSWVRFALRDGSRTPWFHARKLRVNDVMVVTTDGHARRYADVPVVGGLAWEDVGAVEVNDLDLGRTVAGACAGTGAVVMAATAEVLMLGAVEALTGGRVKGDLGLTRAAVHMVTNEAFRRPGEDADIDPAVDLLLLREAQDARPLFSRRAWRRDLILFTFATEGGLDATPTMSSVGGVAAGLRLANVFELGVGTRSFLVASTAPEQPTRLASVPFFRFGLHLDLDAARRIALAVGADLGGLPGEMHARFLYGLRIRLTDRLQVGLYPWNPAVVSQVTNAGGDVSVHSHLNLLELSWLL